VARRVARDAACVPEVVLEHAVDRVEEAVRPANSNAPIERRERLGGLLSFYYRRAA